MINLQKKQSINLVKAAPALAHIRVGLGWDQVPINGQSPDCDVSVFMLDDNGKIPGEQYFVFYNNLVSGDGSVRHNGDNRTGAGEGDDETIDINLQAVSPEVAQIIFTISINNSSAGFNFATVSNASVRVYNSATNQVICQFQLSESFPNSDTLNIGRCYRSGNDWEFEAMGQEYSGGLETALALYGS
jgi:tellurium resistance protein TerD